MLALHLDGSLLSQAPGRYCADHGRTSPSEGGAEIRAGVWVCAQCWRRRRAVAFSGSKPAPPAATLRTQKHTAVANKLLDRTRTEWGLDQQKPVGTLTP